MGHIIIMGDMPLRLSMGAVPDRIHSNICRIIWRSKDYLIMAIGLSCLILVLMARVNSMVLICRRDKLPKINNLEKRTQLGCKH